MAIKAAWENLMNPQYVQIPQENGKRAWKVKIYLIQPKSPLMSSLFMLTLKKIRCGLTKTYIAALIHEKKYEINDSLNDVVAQVFNKTV